MDWLFPGSPSRQGWSPGIKPAPFGAWDARQPTSTPARAAARAFRAVCVWGYSFHAVDRNLNAKYLQGTKLDFRSFSTNK